MEISESQQRFIKRFCTQHKTGQGLRWKDNHAYPIAIIEFMENEIEIAVGKRTQEIYEKNLQKLREGNKEKTSVSHAGNSFITYKVKKNHVKWMQ